ncbi:MAG TPA: acyltransferase family protein [Myxococcales bacterium]|nr:acyltransferase family protein [Myxococcales bacterium]
MPVDPEVEAAFAEAPIQTNDLGFDPWGFHPESAKRYYSVAKQLYRYFRPTVYGIENIPSGRVLLVPNHSGQLPYDGMVLAVACLMEASPARVVRPMAERWVPTLPWVNKAFSRSGVVLGDPINCRNLLEADNAILVFPEGARGLGTTWSNRYKLESFGRGFMRLALQTKTPIVPVGVIGAEESISSVYNIEWLAKLIGTPYVPIPPLLPLLGPLAYMPLPTRYHLHFGKPMLFDGPFDDEDEIIEAKTLKVKAAVQKLLNDGLQQRESIF